MTVVITTWTSPAPCSCCSDCPVCSHCSFAIVVQNSNNCTDDPFSLTITTSVGTATLALPEIDASCLCPDPTGVRGSVIHGGSLPCSAAGLVGVVSSDQTTAVLNNVTGCTMTFRLQSTGNNDCANLGSIFVYKICRDAGCPIPCCLIYSDGYAGDSGAVDQTYIVDNPCCVAPMAPLTMPIQTSTRTLHRENLSSHFRKDAQRIREQKKNCGCHQKST